MLKTKITNAQSKVTFYFLLRSLSIRYLGFTFANKLLKGKFCDSLLLVILFRYLRQICLISIT